MNKKVLVTGVPGVGKTTLIRRVVEDVRAQGYSVGGMITQEFRREHVRVGFEILDLYTGAKGLLAHADLRNGRKVGKYGVDIKGLDDVGVRAIVDGLRRPEVDLLVVDEIGPMELLSAEFRSAVRQAVSGSKPFLGTVQLRLCTRIPEILGSGVMPRIIELTRENRERQVQTISKELLEALTAQDG